MNHKRFLTLLLAGVLALSLTACSGGEERGSSSTAENSSSSTAAGPSSGAESGSKAEGFSLDTPTTADEAAEYFKQALLAGNVDAIEKITGYRYEDWGNVTFDDIRCQTIAQDPMRSRYQFTFTVSQSGSETFPTGTYERIVEVNASGTEFASYPAVTMLYDKSWNYYELFPYDMEQPGYPVYNQVSQYIGFMGSEPFASAADLPVEEMVEYAMITIFGDYSGERELYSVSEVNTRVRELFGAEVDAAQTKFYNAEEGGCELLGRGGMWFYTWTSPAKQDAATGRYTIDVSFYTDALRTLRERTVRYTLEPNGNHFRFISAEEL